MLATKPLACSNSATHSDVQAGVKDLLGYLLDPNQAVQAAAATALKQGALPGVMCLVLEELIAKATGRKPEVQERAVQALQELDRVALNHVQLRLLAAKAPNARRKLVELFGRLSPQGDRQVLWVLNGIVCKRREHENVREAARDAIGRIDPEFERYAGWKGA